ncbi:MAG: serine/threonine-protein kinase [Myxococcota bacterium]
MPLGGVQVDGFLRPGRFGDLWVGRDAHGARVALKLMKPELFKDGEAIRRFQREVRLLRAFAHPNLLQVLDHGTTAAGDPFLVLECVEGTPLTEVVARGPLPVDRVARIGAQVARVLASASARGIVHRGLAPDAILLHGDDEVKVLDFGLARVVAGDAELSGELRLTDRGQRLGDPVYMAPEYIDRFRSAPASDVYALGVLLYELATGDPPFSGRAREVLDAHVASRVPPPSSRVAELPPWFDALVAAMLSKDPAARPDAEQVAATLDRHA